MRSTTRGPDGRTRLLRREVLAACVPEEQLARFKAREETSFKKHKITGEDYRNRERWDEYVRRWIRRFCGPPPGAPAGM